MAVDPDFDPLYPLSARPKKDPRKVDGINGDETSHSLIDNGESAYDISRNKVSSKKLKNETDPTIGSQQYDGGKSATDFTKGFDPNNKSGSIPFALNLIKQIQQNSGPEKILSDIVGGNISSLIGQFLGALKKNDNPLMGQLTNLIQKEFDKVNNNDNRSQQSSSN